MSLHGKSHKDFIEHFSIIIEYLQEVNARNVSIKTDTIISVFPTGDYKMIFYIFDSDRESQIAVFTLVGNNLSSNKDNFG